MKSVLYRDAHAASGARYHAHRAFQTRAVQIGHLHLCDFLDLSLRQLADLDGIGLCACRFKPQRLFDKDGCGRRFQDEREGTILIDRNDDGDDESRFVGGFRVEFLSESGQIDTEGTKGGT